MKKIPIEKRWTNQRNLSLKNREKIPQIQTKQNSRVNDSNRHRLDGNRVGAPMCVVHLYEEPFADTYFHVVRTAAVVEHEPTTF